MGEAFAAAAPQAPSPRIPAVAAAPPEVQWPAGPRLAGEITALPSEVP